MLRVATGGAVAARSKKQRVAAATLAAVQAKSDADIAAAGGHGFGFENQAKAHKPTADAARRRARKAGNATFTGEEKAYMTAHVPDEHRR
jgi:hypothetical protein